MNHLPDVLPFVSILTLISCKRKVDAYKKTINSVANMAVSMKNPKKQKPLDPAAVCGHRDPAAVRELLTKVRDKWSIFLIAPTRQWDTPRCPDGTASCTGMGRSRSLCHHQNDQDKGRRARSCHTEGMCPNRSAPGLCCVSWSARALHGLPTSVERRPPQVAATFLPTSRSASMRRYRASPSRALIIRSIRSWATRAPSAPPYA